MKSIYEFISSQSKMSFAKRMSIGFAIGLVIISIFVFGAPNPNPEWGPYWRVKPLILTPLISSLGILWLYLPSFVNTKSKIKSGILMIISIMVFIASLWIGLVLGLNGTMWN